MGWTDDPGVAEQEALADGDEKILLEAKNRFQEGLEWEAYARDRWLSDYKFVHGDNVNGFQWPDKVRQDRDRLAKPWLTINKVRQHCMIIKNDAKKNKPRMAARPVAGEASYRSSLAYNAIFRGIEKASRAQEVYTVATDHMVEGGWGYFRIVSEYERFDSDEQQIYIRPINDPLSVILDYTIQQPDGSDAEWCIIYKDYPKSEFDRMNPNYRGLASDRTILEGGNTQSWYSTQSVRVAEYFRRKHTPDTLLTYEYKGKKQTFLKSSIPAEILAALRDKVPLRQRPTDRVEIEWFMIMGDQITKRTTFPGKYIPIVRVVAEEYVINNRVDRPGHVRALRDPQRMYNYWATAATEYTAIQTKTPWLAAKEAIEGEVDLYANSNQENPAVLPFRAFMEDGVTPIPKPERVQPPMSAPAYLAGMQQSLQDMMLVSGQYQSMTGEPSNERSGKAINERQRQGDTATYHYIDGLARAIRFAGVVIMDMLPFVYDTKRVLYALQPDGSTLNLTVDPTLDKHYQEEKQQDNSAAQAVLNPLRGQYEVEADIGPDWGTKREETFNALSIIMTQAPGIASMVGDLLLKSADFDLADEAAERLRRAVPPYILGVGPTPQEQQLQQQIAALGNQMQTMKEVTMKTLEENAKLRTILRGKDEERSIDVYDAETKRLGVVQKLVDPEAIQPLLKQLVSDALATHLQEWIGKQNESVNTGGSALSASPTSAPAPQAGPTPQVALPSVLPQPDQENGNGDGGGSI